MASHRSAKVLCYKNIEHGLLQGMPRSGQVHPRSTRDMRESIIRKAIQLPVADRLDMIRQLDEAAELRCSVASSYGSETCKGHEHFIKMLSTTSRSIQRSTLLFPDREPWGHMPIVAPDYALPNDPSRIAPLLATRTPENQIRRDNWSACQRQPRLASFLDDRHVAVRTDTADGSALLDDAKSRDRPLAM